MLRQTEARHRPPGAWARRRRTGVATDRRLLPVLRTLDVLRLLRWFTCDGVWEGGQV
jgi:hypothetical protein